MSVHEIFRLKASITLEQVNTTVPKMRGTDIRVTHWGVTEMRGYLNKGPRDTQNTRILNLKGYERDILNTGPKNKNKNKDLN